MKVIRSGVLYFMIFQVPGLGIFPRNANFGITLEHVLRNIYRKNH